ncbi:hypothetical protein A9264_12910 [Vibrio sp. UCD-FRSSP16_10]|uniref:hypothetical protein n=1 Tax=unclassified Vibrio TaxID=2614977 RepID=UPI0008005D01|nr:MULTISPECIES: hypothetical protein [unclassified Vibrio]OBT15561.1 hypothetical protein A9260_13125 [Vibrio sp. UCD-FRSSP16_30]OBT20634.1 hypothetical protein A9264_12910 [Vibrio sp. UCD-FRSSP16_10]
MRVFTVIAVLGAAFVASTVLASTGFLKSNDVQGFNQTCYYDVLGELHSLNINSTDICPLSHEFDLQPKLKKPASDAQKTGFFKHDTTSGFSKLCTYDVLGESYVITIGSTEICPLTYKF